MYDNNNDNHPISLKGKTVMVAGGTNQAGRAIAEKLAQTGARVIIGDVNLINAEAVAQGITGKYKTEATAVSINIKEWKTLAPMLRAMEANGEKTDIWINLTGIYPLPQMNEINNREPGKHMKDVFTGCEEVAGHMAASRTKGIIVNIMPAGNYATPSGLPVIAAKDKYPAGLTKTFLKQLQTRGIKLFTIAPIIKQATPDDGAYSNHFHMDGMQTDELALLVIFCITVLSRSTDGKLITLDGKQIFICSIL